MGLATPFGTYVGDAVVSVANGYVGASNNAMDDNNISNMQNKWEEKLDFDSFIDGYVTFSGYYDTSKKQYVEEPATLTWDEVQFAENGAKYGYDASAISDTIIGNAAFSCSYLTEIKIPKGITIIDENAFDMCEQLEKVSIPNTVTQIIFGAFHDCNSLFEITFEGTTAQWNKITIQDSCVEYCTINCKDGTIPPQL